MPIISAFFGIIIRMFFDDHVPPHFHAEHAGQNATFDFSGKMLEGTSGPQPRGNSFDSGRMLTNPNSKELVTSEEVATPQSNCSFKIVFVMKKLVTVVKARYSRSHRLRLRFSDGVEKTVDFSQWLHGPVFEPLRDVRVFKRFFLAGGTVCWPNGADIAPEALRAAENAA